MREWKECSESDSCGRRRVTHRVSFLAVEGTNTGDGEEGLAQPHFIRQDASLADDGPSAFQRDQVRRDRGSLPVACEAVPQKDQALLLVGSEGFLDGMGNVDPAHRPRKASTGRSHCAWEGLLLPGNCGTLGCH